MMNKKLILSFFMAILICGCAQMPKRALQAPETALDTGGETTMLFHSVLYYPGAISLNFQGYIVGIEKSPVNRIAPSSEDILVCDKEKDGLNQKAAYKEVVDQKILFISHIVKDVNAPFGIGNCLLYNAYFQPDDNETKQLVETCKEIGHPVPISPKHAYKKSWDALETLRKSIEKRLRTGSYTHIIVITMGWNTVQEEAVRNFNTIIKNIKKAADSQGKPFNPLVIGVTWPSQWQSAWLGPLYRALSFPVKAYDADELGLTWLGVLLHDTLPRALNGVDNGKKIPVVIIGHSFGARASSVAACVGPVIYRAPGEQIDIKEMSNYTLINLQGAFFIRRLFGKHDRSIHFHKYCPAVSRLFLTSSKYDTAMDAMLLGPYAGNDKSYKKYCSSGGSELLSCIKADKHGYIKDQSGNSVNFSELRHIVYINADELIYQNAYLSGGGAHSDIYREEHGMLMWQLISGDVNGGVLPKAQKR